MAGSAEESKLNNKALSVRVIYSAATFVYMNLVYSSFDFIFCFLITTFSRSKIKKRLFGFSFSFSVYLYVCLCTHNMEITNINK